MENKDLGSKKINNEQEMNEGFSGENIPDSYNPAYNLMHPEPEIDQEGNLKTVQRANYDNQLADNVSETDSLGLSNHNDAERIVENKDRNSDVTANRYPNDHPDNHADRGNIKLDQDHAVD